MTAASANTSLRSSLQQTLRRWAASRIRRASQQTLNRRTIYVFPNRQGLLFIVAAGLIFIAAINYAVSLAYALAFLMVSVFILAILYAFTTLNRLTLRGMSPGPVFCGEAVSFPVELSCVPGARKESLKLRFGNGQETLVDLINTDRSQVSVFIDADKRGWFRAPLLTVETTFPLGLCRAWSVLDLQMRCLVYPKPVPFDFKGFQGGVQSDSETPTVVAGSEDYYGIREYSPGDSLRQVAWKNVARGQGMVVKEFVDYVDNRLWLDWDMFYGFGTEERLSRLCYCAIKLSAEGSSFGLKLPGVEIAPSSGAAHRQRVLEALALFGLDSAEPEQAS